MTFRRILFSVLILLMAAPGAMAWQLKGVVTDSSENEPLPYVRIAVENSTYGVISNLKGEYFMELVNGSYNLVLTCVGYQKKIVPLKINNANQTLNIKLIPDEVRVEEVVIKGGKRDAAYEIIDKVIENKHRYLQQFESFKSDTYLKVILEADSLPEKKSKKDSLAALKDSANKATLHDTVLHGYKDKPAPILAKSDSLIALAEADSVINKPVENQEGEEDSEEKSGKKSRPGAEIKPGGGKDEIDAPKVLGRQKLNFIEQVSQTWYAFPHQYKEVVKAMMDYTDKESDRPAGVYIEMDSDYNDGPPRTAPVFNNPYLFIPTVSQSDFNFYRNTIEFTALGQQPFISPISSTGKVYYKYHLEESFMESGMLVHKIQVVPRKWEGPMFEGYIYVVADLWCLKSVDLKVQPSAMNFFNYFEIIHDYERQDTNWLLTREEYFYHLKEGKRNFYGNTLALHKNYELNPEIPKRFFANELRRVEDQAYERDSAWWVEARPVALKPEENRFILMQDSLHEVWNNVDSLHKRDSAYNRVTIWEVLLNGVGFYNRAKKRTIYFNSVLESVQLFSPGGYRQSVGGTYTKEYKKGYVVNVRGDVNYGFTNQDIRGQGQLAFTYLPKRFAKGYVGYGNIFQMLNNYQSFTSFLSRGNYINKIHYSIGQEIEIVNGLYADLELRRIEFRSIDNLKLEPWSDSLFGGNNIPPSFAPYQETQINLKLTFTPFQKYFSEPYKKVIVGSKFPVFTLRYWKSIPNLMGSDLNFDKFELQVSDEFQLGNLGKSMWNVFLGSFINQDSVNFIDNKYFRGSDPVYFSDPLFSFQLLGPSLSTRDPYIQAHYMHNFYGFLFNKIPVVKHLKMMSVAGANLLAVANEQKVFHAEVYAGIQLPFRIKKQVFALGGYYAVSLSSINQFGNQFKFGFSFYDAFKDKWTY